MTTIMHNSSPSILMVAGEASADTHGAEVMRALQRVRPDIHVFGIGGRALRKCGMETVVHAEHMALAGLTEVLSALPRMWRHMRELTRLAASRRPAVAVLIDLPDFNLRLARRLRRLGIPVIYYISPQVWAWRTSRVHDIRAVVDEMLVILPFEADFYAQHGVPSRFVGHPLVEQVPQTPDAPLQVAKARAALGLAPEDRPRLALLPGSRRKEIARHLPVMLAALRQVQARHPEVEAVLPVASTIAHDEIYQLVRHSTARVRLVPEQATEALMASWAAVVCSGTATLQTALLMRPMVVVYRVSWLTYQVLRRLIKVGHIALVNLIAQKRIVPELVQADLTVARLADHMERILLDPQSRADMCRQFQAVRQVLGASNAAATVAEVVAKYLPQPAHNSASSARGSRHAS